MPRRSGRWIALAALLVVAVLVALIVTGRGTLDNDERQVRDRWKPLRPLLADRYTQLAEAAGVVDQIGTDRAVTAEIDRAHRAWLAASRRSDVAMQVASANDLEGLARRLHANVAASAKLSADADVRASLETFDQSVPPEPLVDGFDDATARYAQDRRSVGRRLAAALFGFEAQPALRLT